MTSEERSEPSKVQDELIGAHGRDVVTKLSLWSVADTVTRLLAVVAARGLTVLAMIDHSGEAENVGLHLREPTIMYVGSDPKWRSSHLVGVKMADSPQR
jgi:hypothetical protein